MKLVLATHNAHKVTELGAILGSAVDGLELVGYDHLPYRQQQERQHGQ